MEKESVIPTRFVQTINVLREQKDEKLQAVWFTWGTAFESSYPIYKSVYCVCYHWYTHTCNEYMKRGVGKKWCYWYNSLW